MNTQRLILFLSTLVLVSGWNVITPEYTYKYFNQKVPFMEAYVICHNEGGIIAYPKTSSEFLLMGSMQHTNPTNEIWIGINKFESYTAATYVSTSTSHENFTPGSVNIYYQWRSTYNPNNPNNYKSCVTCMWSNDHTMHGCMPSNCANKNCFICQIPTNLTKHCPED